MFHTKPELVRLRRHLRKNPTDAEGIFRRKLIRAQIRFREQTIVGFYIADFLLTDYTLVVEIDGGYHADQREHDERRDEFLRDCGFRVLRIPNHVVRYWMPSQIERYFHPRGRRITKKALARANSRRGVATYRAIKRGALPGPSDRRYQRIQAEETRSNRARLAAQQHRLKSA